MWHDVWQWIQHVLKLGHVVKPERSRALAGLARPLLAPGGPVGSPLYVGICRGVPLSERDAAKTRYVLDNVELSMRTPGLLAPAITVTRLTHADH